MLAPQCFLQAMVKVSLIVIWSVLVIHSGMLIYLYTCSQYSVSQLRWCYIVIITLLETYADIYSLFM